MFCAKIYAPAFLYKKVKFNVLHETLVQISIDNHGLASKELICARETCYLKQSNIKIAERILTFWENCNCEWRQAALCTIVFCKKLKFTVF